MKVKKIAKELFFLSVVSLTAVLIFFLYLLFIGVPKTLARNLYNEALVEFEKGDLKRSVELLEIAKSYYPETYILNKLDNLSF